MEFPDLGDRCSLNNCGKLDFLPVNCQHCNKIYCKSHISPFIHECKEFQEKILSDQEVNEKERDRWQIPCSQPSCKKKELVPIQCNKCQKFYCLAHRHSDQHECQQSPEEEVSLKKKVSADKARKQAMEDAQAKVRETVDNKLEKAKEEGGPKAAMAKKLGYMKLKMRCKGDPAVPVQERVFFAVECPNPEQNPKPLDLYFSSVLTMGKIVDLCAREARIKNKNHLANAPQLHLFREGICLSDPADKTLKQVLADEGKGIADGDTITLKYLD